MIDDHPSPCPPELSAINALIIVLRAHAARLKSFERRNLIKYVGRLGEEPTASRHFQMLRFGVGSTIRVLEEERALRWATHRDVRLSRHVGLPVDRLIAAVIQILFHHRTALLRTQLDVILSGDIVRFATNTHLEGPDDSVFW